MEEASKKLPSLRSKLETGVLNPNLCAATLIVIVLMIVSPKIVASEKIVSPFAANCTGDLSISAMRDPSCCEILTSNEEMT